MQCDGVAVRIDEASFHALARHVEDILKCRPRISKIREAWDAIPLRLAFNGNVKKRLTFSERRALQKTGTLDPGSKTFQKVQRYGAWHGDRNQKHFLKVSDYPAPLDAILKRAMIPLEDVRWVVILLLYPDSFVPFHVDTTSEWLRRIHIPIQTNESCYFLSSEHAFISDLSCRHSDACTVTERVQRYLNDTDVDVKTLAVQVLSDTPTSIPHAVANLGDTLRVHIVVDVLKRDV
tara:strand:- start:294 stop:998 length:705 start_codon:yes stop_codon:yes gene_type:complete